MACLKRRADLLAALALAAFGLAVYGALLRPDRMLADYDAYVYFYPLRAYAAAAVQEGRLPLWNPHSFLGAPFIANLQTAFFYPFTWLFFVLPVPQAYGINVVLHVLLAGLCFYAFARVSLRVRPAAALVGGSAYMLGGVLSGQYGHLNQLSAVAWLPLILLCGDQAVARRSLGLAVSVAVLIGLQLLAGHPQQTYMTLVGLGLVCFLRGWSLGRWGIAAACGVLVLGGSLGAGLAAIQLFPTAELASESIRGGGLGYREAVADSLWPWLVARALLPSFVNDLGSTEFLGYIGVAPLLLAGIAIGLAPQRRLILGGSLALLGLGLAIGAANPLYPMLYSVVPGIASFRVPARWLVLYTIGAASLAAIGLDCLLAARCWRRSRGSWARLAGSLLALLLLGLMAYLDGVRATRQLQLVWLAPIAIGGVLAAGCAWPRSRPVAVPLLLGLVGLELWAAGADLPPRRPVPLEAYSQPRDSTLFAQSRLAGGRFLSIASEDYELKETPDYREHYASLSEEAMSDFLIAAKRNEILTPNVNLLYRIDDVDGYDGGLLPTRGYLALASLLVSPSRLRPDGMLISRLESLPPRQVMDLLNLRVGLAGRAKDLEQDGVVYDRSLLATLAPGKRLTISRVPARGYTALGIISALTGPEQADGAVVGKIELTGVDGATATVGLVAGQDTAHAQAGVASVGAGLEEVRPWSWRREGDPVEYLAEVEIPPLTLASVSVVNLSPANVLEVRSLTLIDQRDGAFTSLVLDDQFERTSFFDMKVYEYPSVLPRGYLVHESIEADETDALALLADPEFPVRRRAIVAPGSALRLEADTGADDRVFVARAGPELLQLRVTSPARSLLVVSEAFYPGWQVRVDGRLAPLLRANVYLRGVALEPGEHEVTFGYEPESFRWGMAISVGAALIVLALLVLARYREPRRPQADSTRSRVSVRKP